MKKLVLFFLGISCSSDEMSETFDSSSGFVEITSKDLEDLPEDNGPCKKNTDCKSHQICAYKSYCDDLINYDYKVTVSHYEPIYECVFGFTYYTMYSQTIFKSELKSCPSEWNEYGLYQLTPENSIDPGFIHDFKINFVKNDVYEDQLLGSFCWKNDNNECGEIPMEVIHEGKFFGIDDNDYGKFFIKIEPHSNIFK